MKANTFSSFLTLPSLPTTRREIFMRFVTPLQMSSRVTSRSCSTGGSCTFSFLAPGPPPACDPTLKDWLL